MKVAQELKELVHIEVKPGETAVQFALRLLKKVDNLPDDEWDSISKSAQNWVNIAIEANLNKEVVPMPEGIDDVFNLVVADPLPDVVSGAEVTNSPAAEEPEPQDGSSVVFESSGSREPVIVKDVKVPRKSSPKKSRAKLETVAPVKDVLSTTQSGLVDLARARVNLLQGQLVEAENKLAQIEAAASILEKLSEEFLGNVSATPAKTPLASARKVERASGEVPKTQKELVLGVLQEGVIKNTPAVADAIYKMYGVSVDKKSLAPLISGMLSKKVIQRTEDGLVLKM